ncbi:protein FAR1-RELATED SEQUENCE 5-like [Amaranthus tricolor]|uniref:protein FAR1-RELATED SEQUENCE 5-like n=1 Tax=Amaranthus tricolor TaxID=29722 RepID=UPI0025842B94|nr:protein FAR1-RELATED SEQUENCE 5-like [Amaranthus tricolor]
MWEIKKNADDQWNNRQLFPWLEVLNLIASCCFIAGVNCQDVSNAVFVVPLNNEHIQFEHGNGNKTSEHEGCNFDKQLQVINHDGDDDITTNIDIYETFEGLIAEKLEDLEQLYVSHARVTGFSVKKWTQRSSNNIITEKYLVCSCEGKTYHAPVAPEEGNAVSKKPKLIPITRSDCEARNGDISILDKIETIKAFEDANIKPTTAYRYLLKDAGGDEFVGHTLHDHINCVNRIRMKAIECGDAQSVIDQLICDGEKDPQFFYRVRLNEQGQLSALFTCDGMMREDYKIYGDVVIFDTTYRTNRYNLICGPIIGINIHWNTVMFGCAFIVDEKVESFKWVLSYFKKDAAMSKAIENFYKIFKKTVEKWRKREIEAEFYCSRTRPTSNLRLTGLLKHASEIYTASLFRYFEEEFKTAIVCSICEVNQINGIQNYRVWVDEDSSYVETVAYLDLQGDISVSCNCKNFEASGWLCCHCLRVLHNHSVSKILEKYILTRWTKHDKKEVWERMFSDTTRTFDEEDSVRKLKTITLQWRHDMGPKFYNLVLKTENEEGARKIVEDLYAKASETVKNHTMQDNPAQQCWSQTNGVTEQYAVLDPEKSVTKGRRKRIKGHFKKRKHSTSKREFGFITPNKHII